MTVPSHVSASAPQPLEGADSVERYVGQVTSIQKVKKTIGTSDASSEGREFLEVRLKVQTAETLEFPDVPEEEGVGKRPVRKRREVAEGMETCFYFQAGDDIQVHDVLEVTRRSRSAISHGWTSGEFGASHRLLERKTKK